MIDYTKILACLTGTNQLVGYRNSDDSCVGTINSNVTGSTSGKYVTSIPGITMELIKANLSSDYSTVTSYLNYINNEETINAVQDFVKRHKELTGARNLIDNIDPVKSRDIFFTDKVTKSGRFVGIEITPLQSDNVAVWLRMLGTQFDTIEAARTIYLYDCSQNTAIKTFTLTTTKTSSLEWWTLTDFVCNYKSTTGGTGARFILGYYENDFTGQAIDTKLWGNCCGNHWVTAYQKYVNVRGITFESTQLNGTSLPNIEHISYTEQTFGLHLKATVTCDISDTICQNKNLFDSIVQKKLAMRILWDFYNSNRTNANADLSRDKAMNNITRLEKEYEDDLKGIKMDFTDIDRVCQPCAKNTIYTQTMR